MLDAHPGLKSLIKFMIETPLIVGIFYILYRLADTAERPPGANLKQRLRKLFGKKPNDEVE